LFLFVGNLRIQGTLSWDYDLVSELLGLDLPWLITFFMIMTMLSKF
jgi:hypothetical protein